MVPRPSKVLISLVESKNLDHGPNRWPGVRTDAVMLQQFLFFETRISNTNVVQAQKKRIYQLLIARSKGQKMKLSNRTKDAFGISKM